MNITLVCLPLECPLSLFPQTPPQNPDRENKGRVGKYLPPPNDVFLRPLYFIPL